MEEAEAKLKRFLHYGCQDSYYLPCGNLKDRFEPKDTSSIEELLKDDEWAAKVVPIIEKVRFEFLLEVFITVIVR